MLLRGLLLLPHPAGHKLMQCPRFAAEGHGHVGDAADRVVKRLKIKFPKKARAA